MIHLILQITTSLLFIFCCAWVDADFFKAGYRLHSHASRFFMRGCFMLAIGSFNLWHVVGHAMVFASLFDFTLNMLNGDPPLYSGTEAAWDRVLAKLPAWAHIALKAALLCGGMYLIFLK